MWIEEEKGMEKGREGYNGQIKVCINFIIHLSAILTIKELYDNLNKYKY